MPNKVTYEYAIIRIVPKVEREEFMNVGVILFSKRKKYLDIKYHLDEKRLLAFSETIDIDWIRKYLDAWKLVCAGNAESGKIGSLDIAVRYRWLTANRSSIIQSSNTHPGLCEEPAKVLADLFQRYVL